MNEIGQEVDGVGPHLAGALRILVVDLAGGGSPTPSSEPALVHWFQPNGSRLIKHAGILTMALICALVDGLPGHIELGQPEGIAIFGDAYQC